MSLPSREDIEVEAFRAFRASLPKYKGTRIIVCPWCGETVKQYETTYNPLSAWAFKDGVCVDFDGHDCKCLKGRHK